MGDVAYESKKRERATAAEDRHALGSLRERHGLLLKARRHRHRPRVVIPTRRTIRKNKYIDYVGEYHLELLVKLGCLPILVPMVEGTEACLDQYKEGMSGLLIVEGEDIDPRHFKARLANRTYLEKTHLLKDRIELTLVRYALARRIPMLGICRGCQLMNVAAGGTLYGDVQKEKGTARAHIMNDPSYDSYRHPVSILPGTPLAGWYRARGIQVNSYHHQGVRELAKPFRPMACADDGLVEAFYDPRAHFTVGLQFHPERMLSEHPGHLRLWRAFAEAVHSK